MLKGVHLTLLIGPAVPLPAPHSVIEALTDVQVTSSTERSGFQLTFGAGPNSPLLKTMLPAGYLDPIITRVIIVVTVNGAPQVISVSAPRASWRKPTRVPVAHPGSR